MPMDHDTLNRELDALNGWAGDHNAIHKTFLFGDFRAAMAFMQAAIEPIEGLQHHPEWRNVYNTVEVRLTTHDADDTVTAKDLELAAILDRLAG